MKAATLAFLIVCLRKLTEKTSVAGYLTLVVGLLAKRYIGDVDNIAAIISATAGIVLFLLSDAQVKAWLTGQKSDPKPPTVPPNQG